MLSKKLRIALLLGLLGALLAGCSPSAPAMPTAADPAQLVEDAMATIQADLTQTAQAIPPTDSPTETPIPSPTAIRTPPALPGAYQSNVLNALDTPHTYIDDTCEYLKVKWNPNNSPPGTVVMVVMSHWVGNSDDDPSRYNMNKDNFSQLHEDFYEQGFQAIDAQQFADFLEKNAKIPPRSVLWIADDTRHFDSWNKHYRPFYEKYGWPVVTGWISGPAILQTTRDENIALAPEGWIDFQAHGYIHNTPMSDASSDNYLMGELQGSISDLQQYFNKTPIAIIWPGGGFGVRPAQKARELGYRLGFTTNPRGPVMFNWVPLADAHDDRRPAFLDEGYVNDPLMTIPRYMDLIAGAHIDEVRVMGKEAAAFAEQNKAIELEYYNIVCAPTYGAIPTLAP